MNVDFLDTRRLFGARDLRDPVQKWKLEKKFRYAKARLERLKTQSVPFPFPFKQPPALLERQVYLGSEAELLDPEQEFDDWRDAAAADAGVPRFGEI